MGCFNQKRPLSGGLRVDLNGVRPGFLGGTLLIIFGTLLFIDNLGFLPVSVFDAFWPLVFLGAGAYWFTRTSSPVARVWAAASFIAGLLLVLDLLHIVKVTMATLWPLAMIAAGVALVVARTRPVQLAEKFSIGANTNSRPLVSRLEEYAVFSQVKRRIESKNFEGGEVSSVFGGVELDLRWAGISTPGKIAVLEANTAFGAVELRVPETWRISMQGTAVFGAYEDKTIPPRPEPGAETPTLVIKGGTAFGAVIVRN